MHCGHGLRAGEADQPMETPVESKHEWNQTLDHEQGLVPQSNTNTELHQWPEILECIFER
jgi:hypothetical protein